MARAAYTPPWRRMDTCRLHEPDLRRFGTLRLRYEAEEMLPFLGYSVAMLFW